MLIAISDLHFTDATSGRHNLNSEAFTSLFLSDITALAEDKQATELKLLLLGDVVDLVRTTQWFDEDVADRPWGARGRADVEAAVQKAGVEGAGDESPSGNRAPEKSATEKRCLRILGQMPEDGRKRSVPRDTILYQNWDTFAFFRSFGDVVREELGRDLPVELIYVPGNHDRFCNLYPSLRDALREMLGLPAPRNADGAPWYAHAFRDDDYGVFARHGHEYDPYNYGGATDLTRAGHLHPCIGDAIATEFAVKLPHRIEQMSRDASALSPTLVAQLKDMDLVRPLGSVFEWFYYRIKHEDRGEARHLLKQALGDVVEDFLELSFAQQWRAPGLLADEALRAASHRWIRWVPEALIDRLDTEELLGFFLNRGGDADDPQNDPHAQAAYDERAWHENTPVRFVLYGHTHVPRQLPLDGGSGGREVLYLNTGTWRERIYRTVGFERGYDFVKMNQISYTVFYHAGEDTHGKRPGTVSCDIWTGHRKKYHD